MRVGTVSAMRLHGCHHPGQLFDGWDIAVQHLERLAVVQADPDLEPGGAGVLVCDDAAHLEPADFADEHAVLDRRSRPTLRDQLAKLIMVGRRDEQRRQRLGDRR